jgi:hypothetical protein
MSEEEDDNSFQRLVTKLASIDKKDDETSSANDEDSRAESIELQSNYQKLDYELGLEEIVVEPNTGKFLTILYISAMYNFDIISHMKKICLIKTIKMLIKTI